MGTSTRNKGPNWGGGHKNKVTQSCSSGGATEGTARDVLNDYIQRNGGSRSISRGGGKIGNGKSAQRTGRNIARFASRVQEEGLDQALDNFGLGGLVGESAENVVYGLVNRLCEDGGPLDEVYGREALFDLYDEMLEEADSYEDVEEVLEQDMRYDELESILSQFFGRYLYYAFCDIHYERLVKNRDDKTVREYMNDIREFIRAELENKTYDRDISGTDWEGTEGENIIEEIHESTLHVFEK
jgi:hypothetical protein